MSRDYVHLSVDVDTAKMVGMRHAKRQNELVILAIDCKKMLADGYNFYVAENGVWLADYVPAKYLTCMNEREEIS
jgi:putative RNA 2'-phosphotransferase